MVGYHGDATAQLLQGYLHPTVFRLRDLKPSPTHEHHSPDKQPRIAVCSTDVHFKCSLCFCDLLTQGKMCSKTAASHSRVLHITCHVHAWRILPSGGSHLFSLSFLDTPCPASHQTHRADPLYLWEDRWANYHKTKNGAVSFFKQLTSLFARVEGRMERKDGELRTSGAWPRKTKVAVHSNKFCEMEKREGSGMSLRLAP